MKNKHNIDKCVNSKNDKNLDNSNEQVIVINSTHDSTQYGFLLTTIAYIDENRKILHYFVAY